MENTNSSRDSPTECVVVNHGSNMSAAPIRTSIRRLHCSVCDETWEVDTEEYLKVLEMPKWLHKRCGHWNHHQWKEFLYK